MVLVLEIPNIFPKVSVWITVINKYSHFYESLIISRNKVKNIYDKSLILPAATEPVLQPLGIYLASVAGISVRHVQAPATSRLKEIILVAIFGLPWRVHVIALVTAPLVAVNGVIPYALHALDDAAVNPTSFNLAGISP